MVLERKFDKSAIAIVIGVQKGGVGKTTNVLQLAFYMTLIKKKKVLIVDMDSQGNASSRASKKVRVDNLCDEFTRTADLFSASFNGEVITETNEYGIDLIRSNNRDLELREIQKAPTGVAAIFYKNFLDAKLLEQYDYILFDTPPSYDTRIVSALLISKYIVLPMKMAAFSEAGVRDMLADCEEIREKVNPDLHVVGLISNMMNLKNNEHLDSYKKIQEATGGLVIKQTVSTRSSIDKAILSGEPIWKNKSGAARVAAKELSNVYGEILKRINKHEKAKKS